MEKYTSTKFIGKNLVYPPIASKDRLSKYKLNASRYANEYNKSKQLQVLTPAGMTTLNINMTSTNYFKLVTDKMLSLLLNEKPNVTVNEVGNTEYTKVLNDLIEDIGFWAILQEVMRTFSYDGDGVFYLYSDGRGNPKINAVDPATYYKVSDIYNIRELKCYVLVQEIFEEKYNLELLETKFTHLRVLEHYKGYYIEKYYKYDGYTVGSPVKYTKPDGVIVPAQGLKVITGYKGFAVLDVNNSKLISEVHGISDYSSFDSALLLKEKKIAQIDGVTDKHFDPMIQGPHSLMKQNELTGNKEFNGRGNYIALSGQDKDVKYVSWDAKTEAVAELIDRLDNEIAILSEMGKTFLYGEFGNASGEALKTMLKSALDKVSRVIDTIEPTIKTIFVEMLYKKGIVIKPSDINIEWQDGISEGDNVKATTIATRVGSNTLSVKRALMKYDGLTAEQADDEIAQIQDERGMKDGETT